MYRPQQDGDLPAFVQGLPAAGWTLGANNRFGDQQAGRILTCPLLHGTDGYRSGNG